MVPPRQPCAGVRRLSSLWQRHSALCQHFHPDSFAVMKKLFVLAALLTAGAYSAQAQTGTTTTTTRQTTTTPATSTPDQMVTPSSTTTTESTTTSDQTPDRPAVRARSRSGKTVIEPADGAKVKSNGKRIKIK